MTCVRIIFTVPAATTPVCPRTIRSLVSPLMTSAQRPERTKIRYCLGVMFFSVFRRTPLASLSGCFLPAPRRDALIQVTAQFLAERSSTDGVFPSSEVLCVSRRSDGSERCCGAGRQRCSSAKCSSCLPLLPFSLARCREQESRPRFLTNEDNSRDHIVYTDCIPDKLSQLLKSTAKQPFPPTFHPQECKIVSKTTCQGHMGHMTHHRCSQTSALMLLFLRTVRAQNLKGFHVLLTLHAL